MALADELVRLQARLGTLASTFMTQRAHVQRLSNHRHHVTDADVVQALVNVNDVVSDLCEVVNELVAGMQRQADASLNQFLSQAANRR